MTLEIFNYEQLKIETFPSWTLYLHKEQYPYLGRCYAAAIRPEAEHIAQITGPEASELNCYITPLWYQTVQKLYQADWPNLAILGNEWRHLHAHLIPRYFSPRNFYGYEFIDPQPNKNYAPYPKKELPLELLFKIRDDIKKELERI